MKQIIKYTLIGILKIIGYILALCAVIYLTWLVYRLMNRHLNLALILWAIVGTCTFLYIAYLTGKPNGWKWEDEP